MTKEYYRDMVFRCQYLFYLISQSLETCNCGGRESKYKQAKSKQLFNTNFLISCTNVLLSTVSPVIFLLGLNRSCHSRNSRFFIGKIHIFLSLNLFFSIV